MWKAEICSFFVQIFMFFYQVPGTLLPSEYKVENKKISSETAGCILIREKVFTVILDLCDVGILYYYSIMSRNGISISEHLLRCHLGVYMYCFIFG
jgi:hypothetical protein